MIGRRTDRPSATLTRLPVAWGFYLAEVRTLRAISRRSGRAEPKRRPRDKSSTSALARVGASDDGRRRGMNSTRSLQAAESPRVGGGSRCASGSVLQCYGNRDGVAVTVCSGNPVLLPPCDEPWSVPASVGMRPEIGLPSDGGRTLAAQSHSIP